MRQKVSNERKKNGSGSISQKTGYEVKLFKKPTCLRYCYFILIWIYVQAKTESDPSENRDPNIFL